MAEPAKFMIVAIEGGEFPHDEGKCLAIRFFDDDNYETTEPLVRSMCRQIRKRRRSWKMCKPREIEESMVWKIFSTDPGSNGWPAFLYFWDRR